MHRNIFEMNSSTRSCQNTCMLWTRFHNLQGDRSILKKGKIPFALALAIWLIFFKPTTSFVLKAKLCTISWKQWAAFFKVKEINECPATQECDKATELERWDRNPVGVKGGGRKTNFLDPHNDKILVLYSSFSTEQW